MGMGKYWEAILIYFPPVLWLPGARSFNFDPVVWLRGGPCQRKLAVKVRPRSTFSVILTLHYLVLGTWYVYLYICIWYLDVLGVYM